MRRLGLVVLLIALLAVSIVLVAAACAQEASEAVECFSRERAGLLVTIETTALAWPGDNMSLAISAAATQANIHVNYVRVCILSLRENRSETVLENVTILENAGLSLGETNQTTYVIAIPSDTMPGLLYGEVKYEWSIVGDAAQDEAGAFLATVVRNKPYLDLLEDYGDLQQQYRELAGSQADQEGATGLMYVFLITTGIFVVTTILFLATHPKRSAY